MILHCVDIYCEQQCVSLFKYMGNISDILSRQLLPSYM